MRAHALLSKFRSIGSLIASALLSLVLSACVAQPPRVMAVECPKFPPVPAEFKAPLPTLDLLQPEELPAAKRMLSRPIPASPPAAQ